MAPDSADVEMESQYSNLLLLERSGRKLYSRLDSGSNGNIRADEYAVNRPATEDEDTEQKIINEGSSQL